jgi:hypothetical protein
MEREEAFKAAKMQQESRLAACDVNFPPAAKKYMDHAKCVNDAVNVIRPFVPYPDLLDQDNANRMLMAERLQQGKMTPAEATQEMAQRRSQVLAEEQRRGLANRAVSAQESAAAAAWKGTTCTRIGDTVNCY